MSEDANAPLDPEDREALLATLETRFRANMERHPDVAWADVRSRLDADSDKLRNLAAMERTGGEPDVVDWDAGAGEVVFCDCAPESPAGRRSLCYDDEALAARKRNKPDGSAVGMATAMGVQLLDEDQYRTLQGLGEFDTTTSSWLRTPDDVRELGGAIFGDYRFGRVFIYHNGAQSYYAARGFRCMLRV